MAEYIKRDTLLSKKHGCNRKDCSNCDFFTANDSWCEGELFIVDVLNAPSADVVERKHGSWRHYEGELTCSECAVTIYDDIMSLLGDDVPRFCPNCGAEMTGGE